MTNLLSALEEQLAHCDGVDCNCMAHGECECACDADWTPAEVYRLRAERDALRARIKESPVRSAFRDTEDTAAIVFSDLEPEWAGSRLPVSCA